MTRENKKKPEKGFILHILQNPLLLYNSFYEHVILQRTRAYRYDDTQYVNVQRQLRMGKRLLF